MDESAGDEEKLLTDRIRLQRLNEEYKRFSKAAGLRTEQERLWVNEFGREQAARAISAMKGFDRFSGQIVGKQTNTGIVLGDVSPHVYGRALERKVSAEQINNALTKPLETGIIRADRSQQFVGEFATVAINVDTGKVVTVWPTSIKRVERLKRKKGGR